jgi:hypothetical protein
MDKITAISEAAKAFFGERMAALGFVGPIVLHINPEILRAMCKLALVTVWAAAAIHVVFAEGALGLRGGGAVGGDHGGEGQAIMATLHFFSFSRGFGFDIEGRRLMGVQGEKRSVHGKVYNAINDYSPINDLQVHIPLSP